MNDPISIGFPRMKKEAGERRVFLPNFIQYLAGLGARVVIEEGYGSRSGFSLEDYRQGSLMVQQADAEETYNQDIVLVLRSPTAEEMRKIRPGTVLISMLHYPTRPERFNLLASQGIKAISLDSIVDDFNIRLVENMKAVAWNGLEAAFDVLDERFPDLKSPHGEPWRVLVLGTGMVGKYAIDAATHLGNIERNNEHIKAGGVGALAISVGRNLSDNPARMERLFAEADILVDATQRRKTSQPVVPNPWIAWLPEHAVIADLAVDPYLLNCTPPVVRGVEGIPQGNLDQYIFHPEDPNWDLTVPAQVDSKHRRTAVTCYSWPGIHPEACMHHYAHQLEPLMDTLLAEGYDGLGERGTYHERALYRATLKAWELSRAAVAGQSPSGA